MSVAVRIGIPSVGGALPRAARTINAPLLVSANALAVYRDRDGTREFHHFRASAPDLDGLDVALDSAGFVAWAHYGGFPWSVEEYVRLAASRPWVWWSQMDACCEPQLAGTPDAVRFRQAETIRLLLACQSAAREIGAPAPMPVLQGWAPADYVWHVRQLCLDGVSLVGVGSVCRRHVHGAHGLLAVVDALDRVLPRGVRLHLFGVKSDGLAVLASHPRVESIDSMAWDFAARAEGRAAGSCTTAIRVASMRRWYERQTRVVGVPRSVTTLLPLDLTPAPRPSAEACEWADLLADNEIDTFAAARFALEDAMERSAHTGGMTERNAA